MDKAIVVATALLALGACKKASKSATSGSATGSAAGASAGDCKTEVAGAFHRAARAGMEKGATEGGAPINDAVRHEMDSMQKDLEARFQPVIDAIAAVCVSDHWSPEMLDCVRQAKTGDAIDACNSHLDDAQRKHLDEATNAAEAKGNANAGSPTCNKYADLEIKCNAAGEDARPTILDFCAKARAGAKEATYQLIALESTCADTATDCDSYKACVEKKKSETSPTP